MTEIIHIMRKMTDKIDDRLIEGREVTDRLMICIIIKT